MDARASVPWEACNEFVLACGEQHEQYGLCAKALEGIRTIIPYDQGMFFMLDGNRRIVRWHLVDTPERWVSSFFEYYSRMASQYYSFDRDIRAMGGRNGTVVVDWGQYHDTRDDFIAHYIRPRNLSETLSITLYTLHGSPSVIFCMDRLGDRVFDEGELEVVRNLAAHLNNLYRNLLVQPERPARLWDASSSLSKLTPREREVLDLICQGFKPAYIARELTVALSTVNKHIANIHKKLNVSSKQELLVMMLGH